MKKYWVHFIILSLIFLPACATKEKSAVQTLLENWDPIEAMRFPEQKADEQEPKPDPLSEPTIEITAGSPDTQELEAKAVIDPELLDKIPDKPVIKQVRIDGRRVRLRQGPGLNFKIIGAASKGDLFNLLGVQTEPETAQSWYMMEDEEGKKYFVSGMLATILEEPEESVEEKVDAPKTAGLDKEILVKRRHLSPARVRSLINPVPPLPPELKKAKHITLNFEGTEIYDVITTFCELLKIDYFIEGGIQGKVTLQTFNKIPVRDLYSVLEQILALHNVTVVRSGNFYRFLPIKDALQKPLSLHYGNDPKIPARERLIIQIIPLKHISVESMKKIITPLLTKSASFIDVPDTRNLMMIEMAYNVKRILKVVETLDIDKLSSKDIQLYKIQHADAETIVEELQEIFSSMGYESALGNSLNFLSLDRLNSILVVNAFESILPTIDFWIKKLDQPISKGEISTFVYYVQNSDSQKLANILNSIFQESRSPATTRPREGERDRAGLRRDGDRPGANRRTDSQRNQSDRQRTGATTTGRQAQENQRDIRITTSAGVSDTFEGEITIIPDQDTNSLIIRTSPRNYPSILEIIKKLDLFPQQVLIEVLILDLTLDEETEMGLEWALQGSQNKTILAGGVTRTNSSLGALLGTATSTLLPGGSFYIARPDRFVALLQAFSKDSKANVLANPILMTSDNKPASISITDEIPIESTTLQTQTQVSTTSTTIQFRSVGIKLDILPKINSDNYVNLQINQEISAVGAETFGATSTPSFTTRQVNTEVVLKDNQILVMGGLIRTDITESSEGFPGLRKIPLIGKLFGVESTDIRKTELMIFITPHIISNDKDSEFVTKQFRKRLGSLQSRRNKS